MAPKKTMILQMVGLLVLLGGALWLFVSFGNFSSYVTCLLDQIDVLKSVQGEAGALAGQVAGQIPSAVTDQIRTFVPLLGLLIIAPAVLIAVIEVFVVICSANICKKSSMDETCAKLLIVLLTVFLAFGIVCYLIIGGIGIALSLPEAQEVVGQVEQVCDVEIPAMQLEVTKASDALTDLEKSLKDAEEQLDALPAGAPGVADQQKAVDDALAAVADGQFELGEAEKMLNSMGNICDCVQDAFGAFSAFTAPGFLCCAACILILCLNCVACCNLCCGKKKKDTTATVNKDNVAV